MALASSVHRPPIAAADASPTIAQALGTFAAGLAFAQVPEAARSNARRAILDVVGVAYAGAGAPLAQSVRTQALENWREGPCSLIGAPARLVPVGAAYANAVAAHVLDFDANFNTGMVFAPAVLFPALLAAGEARGASGQTLLTAFTAGTEVACVLAAALSPEPYRKDRDSLFYRGWFNTAVLGPIAAAAAVARLLGLEAEATTRAVSIAAVQAGGLRIGVGSDMKPLLAARASETGLRAALLAEAGAQAPDNAIEGHRGLIATVNGGAWTPGAFARLGAFADPGTSFKLYPACSSVQAAAEALEALVAEEGLAWDDIARVRCEVTSHIAANLAFPRPQTVTQAQFSMPFALACLLVHGRFTADMLTDARLAEPALGDAMDRVEMAPANLFADEADAHAYPEATRVVVTLKDGRNLARQQDASTGKPVNPMSDALLDAKFLRNTMAALGAEGAERLRDTLRAVDQWGDVRTLLAGGNHP